MKASSMKPLTVGIIGAKGALGHAVVKEFARQSIFSVLEIDPRTPNAVAKLVGGDASVPSGYFSAVVHVAGGFEFDPKVKSDSTLNPDILNRMWRANVDSALAAFQLANSSRMSKGAPLFLTAAAFRSREDPKFQGMYDFAPEYTLSKLACLNLASFAQLALMDKGSQVFCLTPGILDTPRNRRDMPSANPAGWISCDAIARYISKNCLVPPRLGLTSSTKSESLVHIQPVFEGEFEQE